MSTTIRIITILLPQNIDLGILKWYFNAVNQRNKQCKLNDL